MARRFSTEEIPEAEQFDYWHELIGDVFPSLAITPNADYRGKFSGQITQHVSVGFAYAEVIADGYRARRSPEHIRRRHEDAFMVVVQRTGVSRIEQDGRKSTLLPGQFLLCDSTRPYSLDLPAPFHHALITLPGGLLRDFLSGVERFTARPLAGDMGVGKMFLGLVDLLRESSSELDLQAIYGVADSLVGLLCAAISTLPEARRKNAKGIETYHRQRILKVVREKLMDPQLTVDLVAETVQLSPRYIFRLFSNQGISLTSWIWHERLNIARRELSSPLSAHRSIADIAFSIGFKDAAHFSRMFKSVFERTPSDFRKHAEASRPLIDTPSIG